MIMDEVGGGVLGIIGLITWVIAAIGGAIMLRIWVSRGGARRTGGAPSRFPPGLIFGHFLLAAAGLVVWIIYMITDADILSWISFIILLIVAALGTTMFARWSAQGRGGTAGAGTTTAGGAVAGEQTAERHFPVAVVAAHGLFAVATVVIVLLVALKVGGS
jgi:hypothetical protein